MHTPIKTNTVRIVAKILTLFWHRDLCFVEKFRYSVCRIAYAQLNMRSFQSSSIDFLFRSYIADLKHKIVFFHGCEVALTSHICFSIRPVFHEHLHSHIPILASHPNLQTTHEGNFYTCRIANVEM